jgi:hypothetical protein
MTIIYYENNDEESITKMKHHGKTIKSIMKIIKKYWKNSAKVLQK